MRLINLILPALFLLFIQADLFAQSLREVPYTKALTVFIDSYFNNQIPSIEAAEVLYLNALDSLPADTDEYTKEVHKARCEYILGMYIMGEYDLSSVQKIKSMIDTEDKTANLAKEIKEKRLAAASCFDKGIAHAQSAMKLQNGSDAMTIYVQCLSSNCTVKQTSYVIANGLKVQAYSKKALTKDAENATAAYYAWAQDLYAPEFFANYKRGFQKMYSNFTNEALHFEKFDRFSYMTAIAYAYNKLNDKANAIEWYKKALEVYPKNHGANETLKKLISETE